MSRLLFQRFNYEVDEDPINAVMGVHGALDDDIDQRINLLSELSVQACTLTTTEVYENACNLAEDMLAYSSSKKRSSVCRGERFIDGMIATRSLGNFLICKAIRCDYGSPDYALFIQNEKLEAAVEQDEDTYLDVAVVAKIEDPNDIYHPSLAAELQSSYENMLTVANDRLRYRKRFRS